MSEYREHDIVEVCMKIHGSFTGSGDAVHIEDMKTFRDWLAWRVADGWEASTKGDKRFDHAVLTMARATIAEAETEMYGEIT